MNILRWILMLVSQPGTLVAARAATSEAELPYTRATRVTTVVKMSTNNIGARLAFPATTKPEATILRVTIPPHGSTGWHRHLFQGFGYVLSGDLTIISKGHSPRLYHGGQGFAESINAVHRGLNTSHTPVELLVLFLGIRGQPFVSKAH